MERIRVLFVTLNPPREYLNCFGACFSRKEINIQADKSFMSLVHSHHKIDHLFIEGIELHTHQVWRCIGNSVGKQYDTAFGFRIERCSIRVKHCREWQTASHELSLSSVTEEAFNKKHHLNRSCIRLLCMWVASWLL